MDRKMSWVGPITLFTLNFNFICVLSDVIIKPMMMMKKTLNKLLSYCVLRPTQPPTLSGTGTKC